MIITIKSISVFLLMVGLIIILPFSAISSGLMTISNSNSYVPDENVSKQMVTLQYDNTENLPSRDDPGEDWLFFDNARPQTLTTGANLWARVRFTPAADFTLWGVSVMPLNQGPNPDVPCEVRVYREDQDNHNLGNLVWEAEIEELRAYNANDIMSNFHWVEIEDEDDRIDFEAGEHFTVMYGPAPGGAYQPGQQGAGWWTLWDGGTEVERSYVAAGPPEAHGGWGDPLGGDLFIRANGEYTEDFVDLGVTSVFNAEDEADRRWIATSLSEKHLYAEITNDGAAIEGEFIVSFVVFHNEERENVFESEVAVEGIDVEEVLIVECDEVWEVPREVGHYTVWATVDVEDDANDENDVFGLDQIVFDQEDSRDMWIGFVDENLEGSTNYQDGNGWAVRFDHPGGEVPLWLTSFRVGLGAAAGLECPFMVHVVDIDTPPEEWGEIEPVWSSRVESEGAGWVTAELEEDDYITIHDGEGLLVTYMWVNGGAFQGDETPPIAGTNTSMPAANMQTSNQAASFTRSASGDFAIQIQMTGPDHGGYLEGSIYDFETDEPIEGVMVVTSQDHRAFTNEEGYYEFPFGPLGEFTLTASKQGFNDGFRDDLELGEDDSLEVNIGLLHPEFELSIDDVIEETGLNGEVTVNFNVINDGNGLLEFSVERRLLEEFELDPWSLRASFMVGQELEDTRVEGVLQIDNHYYFAAGNNRDPVIYIFDEEMAPVGDIEQPVEDNWGFKDLAWDGDLIWGSIPEMIYGIDLEGDVIHSFESPETPITSLAWDPVNDVLWSCGTTSDIISVDTEGNVDSRIDRQGLRMYGLSYFPEDEDGFNLYISYKDQNNDDLPSMNKCNVETGEMEFVTTFETEIGGDPKGAFITNQLDPYSWVLLSIANGNNEQGGDRVDYWQISSRRDWFAIDPENATVDPDDDIEMTLTLNATGLPFDTFEARLIFHHNAEGGETVLPISFEVNEIPINDQRTIELALGWNMVSVNLQPDEEDVEVLTADLVENELLLMMKNGVGQFYSPEYNYNSIPGWFVPQGYLIKMADSGQLTLEGMTVMAWEPIDLLEGWQMISYYPREPVDAVIALSGLGERLIMAKDGMGMFYNREYDYSNMGDMVEGKGYLIKVDEDTELIYNLGEEEALGSRKKNPSLPSLNCRILPQVLPTSNSMSLLVLTEQLGNCELAVYAGDKMVGSGAIENEMTGCAIWGDDPHTEIIDGALANEELRLEVFNQNGSCQAIYKTLTGENKYQVNGMWIIELQEIVAQPVEFGISAAYPNPFNSSVKLIFALPIDQHITLSIYDLNGRLTENLINGELKSGIHTVNFSGLNFPSGIYIAELKSGEETSKWKIGLVK